MTIEAARAYGLSESQIESMSQKGFFAAIRQRSDVESDIDAIECDLESWEAELAELTETISKAKVRLARLRQQLAELPPDEDD